MSNLTINNEILDPVMGLTVPTYTTPGTLYATDITSDLLIVASHTHTGSNNLDGNQLNADSLNITTDINLNSTNLDSARSLRLTSNTSNIGGPSDINCVYDVNGDLWFNDGFGNKIRLTQSGSISPSAAANTLEFVPVAITGSGPTPFVIPTNAIYNLLNVNVSTLYSLVNLPISSNTPAGRIFYFNDVNNNASNNNITIEISNGSGDTIDYNGTAQSGVNLTYNGASGFVYNGGSGVWYLKLFTNQAFKNTTLSFTGSTVILTNSNMGFIGSTLSLDNNSSLNLPAIITNSNPSTYTPIVQCPIEINSSINFSTNSSITGYPKFTVPTNITSTLTISGQLSVNGGATIKDSNVSPTSELLVSTNHAGLIDLVNNAAIGVTPGVAAISGPTINLFATTAINIQPPTNIPVVIEGSLQVGSAGVLGVINNGCVTLSTGFTNDFPVNATYSNIATHVETTGAAAIRVTDTITANCLIVIPTRTGGPIMVDVSAASNSSNYVISVFAQGDTPSSPYTYNVWHNGTGLTSNGRAIFYCDGSHLYPISLEV